MAQEQGIRLRAAYGRSDSRDSRERRREGYVRRRRVSRRASRIRISIYFILFLSINDIRQDYFIICLWICVFCRILRPLGTRQGEWRSDLSDEGTAGGANGPRSVAGSDLRGPGGSLISWSCGARVSGPNEVELGRRPGAPATEGFLEPARWGEAPGAQPAEGDRLLGGLQAVAEAHGLDLRERVDKDRRRRKERERRPGHLM